MNFANDTRCEFGSKVGDKLSDRHLNIALARKKTESSVLL
jgi:hypothetical protein